MTVQDLRPNSQDTSAFYLGSIYQVLADPNVTRPPIPSVAEPPRFSPPRYSIWVNSLWFLSLVMSLSCALLATSLHQWARRYIRLTQPARCSPEKRARMQAYFADGVDKMHIPWAVEGLPTLLHLSVFLFFGGLIIFLFNTNREVFISVVWWIGLFSLVYGSITLLPLIQQDSPYESPLTTPAWFLYASIQYIAFKIRASVTSGTVHYQAWRHQCDLRERYRGWMLGGVEKAAEEKASERSSKIDFRILDWTISALGDDDSQEKFFEAVPGFFNSKLVNDLERDLPETFLRKFWGAMDGFLGRTLSSNSVPDSVKSRRVVICRDIMSMMPCPNHYLLDNLRSHFDQAPALIERIQAMARWFTHTSSYVSYTARITAAKYLVRVQERDNRWIASASHMYGLSQHDLRANVALGGDNTLLATLIDVSRQALHSDDWKVVEALTQFDIRHTLPGLQHDFCTLWNELVQEARNRGRHTTPVHILRLIRHLYIALHQDTDTALTAFPFSANNPDPVLWQPSSFPLCDAPSHHPDSTTRVLVSNPLTDPFLAQPGNSYDASPPQPVPGGSTILRQAEEANIITGPPSSSHPATTNEIREKSQALPAIPLTFPIDSGSRLTFSSPPPAGVRDEGRDQNQTISMEVFRHQTESLLPFPLDIVPDSSENEGRQHGLN